MAHDLGQMMDLDMDDAVSDPANERDSDTESNIGVEVDIKREVLGTEDFEYKTPTYTHFWQLAAGVKYRGFCYDMDRVNQPNYVSPQVMELAFGQVLQELHEMWDLHRLEVERQHFLQSALL